MPPVPLRKIDVLRARLEDPRASWSEFELHSMLREVEALPDPRTEVEFTRGLILGHLGDELGRRGQLEEAQARWAKATEAFRRAIDFGEDSWQVHFNIGVALSRLGNEKNAVEAHIVATEKEDVDVPTVYGEIVRTFFGRGAFSEAREVLAEAIERQRSVLDLMELASLADAIGEPRLALELVVKASGTMESDVEGAARAILETRELSEGLRFTVNRSLRRIETARRKSAEDVGQEPDSGEESLAVLEMFSDLRARANAAGMGWDDQA